MSLFTIATLIKVILAGAKQRSPVSIPSKFVRHCVALSPLAVRKFQADCEIVGKHSAPTMGKLVEKKREEKKVYKMCKGRV